MSPHHLSSQIYIIQFHLVLKKINEQQTSKYPIIATQEASTPNPAPVNKILSDGIIIEKMGVP